MSPSEKPFLRLRIVDPHGQPVDDCDVAVMDGRKNRVFEYSSLDHAEHQHNARLAQGLYDVQVTRGTATTRQLVRHAEDHWHEITIASTRSAMPSPGSTGMHEYYAEPARHFSTTSSSNADTLFDGADGRCRLMLFVRLRDKNTPPEGSLFSGLSLCHWGGELITEFDANVIEENQGDGWAAFAAALPEGLYILRWGHQLLPLSVITDWGTYLFLPYVSQVDLAGGTIFLNRPNEGYDPYSATTEATNRVVALARAGTTALPLGLRRQMWDMKFENPILGLLAVYATLDANLPHLPVVDVATDNLAHLMPGSPDIDALRIAVAMARDDTPDPVSIKGTPMLGRSVATLHHAINTFHHPILWEPGPLFNYHDILVGSLWTLWEDPVAASELAAPPEVFERQPAAAVVAAARSLLSDAVPPGGGSDRTLAQLQALVASAVETYWREGDRQALDALLSQLSHLPPTPDDSDGGGVA